MGSPGELNPADAYRRHAGRVLSYLRARGAAEPEDVLGEVFVQVARDARRFRGHGPTDERRWIFTIARNRLIDATRAAARRPVEPRENDDLRATPPPEPIDPALISALEALTDEQREVVVLRFVADLSLNDVAAVTGRKANAVKQLQHRALAALRRRLDPIDGDDELDLPVTPGDRTAL
ncbi:MAG TPA: sigma-70 family RNA polymerase sigma factor [Acidimicrobiales bacterium]|jgi:RNA polymerase sigma-70 factor (ECF subfamily)